MTRKAILAEMEKYFEEYSFAAGLCEGCVYGQDFIDHMAHWLERQEPKPLFNLCKCGSGMPAMNCDCMPE